MEAASNFYFETLRLAQVVVEPGSSIFLCMCGQSARWPYCDGAHRAYNAANGTSFASFKVSVAEGEEAKTVFVCTCGHSKNRPFCDGSHRSLHAVA